MKSNGSGMTLRNGKTYGPCQRPQAKCVATRVKRRSAKYNSYPRYSTLHTNEDLIANYLLVLSHSFSNANSGAFVNYNCVAVCKVGKELLVASNGIAADQIRSILKNFRRILLQDYSYPFSRITVLSKSSPNMHAEMQILEELEKRFLLGSFSISNLSIGVSKPCCEKCAEMLRLYGIKFSRQHGDKVKKWDFPQVTTLPPKKS